MLLIQILRGLGELAVGRQVLAAWAALGLAMMTQA